MIKKRFNIWDNREDICLEYCVVEGLSAEDDNIKKPAVIICPGGGYLMIADSEAYPVAERFSEEGYRAFVLRYSIFSSGHSAFPGPVLELAKAMLYIKANAGEMGVDEKKVAVCGFSAGGHLAASFSVLWQDEMLSAGLAAEPEAAGLTQDKISGMLRPDAVVLGYPVVDQTPDGSEWTVTMPNGEVVDMRARVKIAVFGKSNPTIEEKEAASPISLVSQMTPPTFVWHTAEDNMVDVEGTLKYGLELSKNKVPFEIHIFDKGPHALSLCDATVTSDPERLSLNCRAWPEIAFRWLDGILKWD